MFLIVHGLFFTNQSKLTAQSSIELSSSPSVIQSGQLGSYSNGSWGWSGNESTSHYSDIADYEKKPEKHGAIKVTFQSAKLNKLGNRCRIMGRVVHVADGTAKPVNWFQGISIYLAKTPEKKCDWSSGISAETEHDLVILNNDGSFEAEFDLRDTYRDPNVKALHQIGI